jgi:hypothetical protein
VTRRNVPQAYSFQLTPLEEPHTRRCNEKILHTVVRLQNQALIQIPVPTFNTTPDQSHHHLPTLWYILFPGQRTFLTDGPDNVCHFTRRPFHATKAWPAEWSLFNSAKKPKPGRLVSGLNMGWDSTSHTHIRRKSDTKAVIFGFGLSHKIQTLVMSNSVTLLWTSGHITHVFCRKTRHYSAVTVDININLQCTGFKSHTFHDSVRIKWFRLDECPCLMFVSNKIPSSVQGWDSPVGELQSLTDGRFGIPLWGVEINYSPLLNVQTVSESHPYLYSLGTENFYLEITLWLRAFGWRVRLTAQLHTMPRLRMVQTVLPFPLYDLTECIGHSDNIYIYIYIYICVCVCVSPRMRIINTTYNHL